MISKVQLQAFIIIIIIVVFLDTFYFGPGSMSSCHKKQTKRVADALNDLNAVNLRSAASQHDLHNLIADYFVTDSDVDSVDLSSSDDEEEVLPVILDTAEVENNISVENLDSNNHDFSAKNDSIEVSVQSTDSENLDMADSDNDDGVQDDIIEAMNAIDFVQPDTLDELNRIDNFKCECVTRGRGKNPEKMSCIKKLSREKVAQTRMEMAELTADEKDLVLIAKISVLACFSEYTQRSKRTDNKVRTHPRTLYVVDGETVCRSTFIFVHNTSLKVHNANYQWYKSQGISKRDKKRGGRRKANLRNLTFEDIKSVVTFIVNYADANSIILPGRHPGQKEFFEIKLLLSHITKAEVFRLYESAMKATGARAVKLSTFRKLWLSLLPRIVRTKPMTDLCALCQKNNYAVFRSANLPEEVKTQKLKEQELHLVEVKKARDYYKSLIAESKDVVKQHMITKLNPTPPLTLKSKMHYSFDYAQQVFFPSDPLQPGPMYFLTPRKCGVFGICCEALPCQVNYLVDEGMAIDKGSQSVINYLDHFFCNYGLGEHVVDLHCDNCSGQNKNKFMLNYLCWRIIHKLHHEISLNFLVTGHTKFAPDWCFGLFKQRYRRTRVNTLEDIARCVDKSTVTGVNIPQLVGNESGDVYVQCKDWKRFLDPYFRVFPKIKSYHYFSFNSETPGLVTARKEFDSPDSVQYQLLKNVNIVPPAHCDIPIRPVGLDAARQQYLFEQIAPFCDDYAVDITCPDPAKKRST